MAVTFPISMHVMGGLGNQLFQIITGLNYAIEHNTAIEFPYKEVVSENPYRIGYWSTFLKSISYLTRTIDIYRYRRHFVNDFHYVNIPTFEEEVCLQGYFQSYKYFEKHFSTICKMIKLQEQKKQVKIENKELFDTTKETISLHFRLGDYVKQQENHPVLSLTYYRAALATFDKMQSYRVLYFCEAADNDTVQESIKILQTEYPNMEFIKVPDAIEDYKQMLIMANCNYNIIANSSFSWWGAYFNTESKGVFYPSKWFGPTYKHYNTKDMCPPSWKIISVE